MDIQDQYLDIQLCDKHLTYSVYLFYMGGKWNWVESVSSLDNNKYILHTHK